MKTATTALFAAVLLLLTFAPRSHAIERLQISVQCPDVVLAWPSADAETYLVQYRQTLDTNSTWITLTNLMPNDAGTNWTTFVHSNQLQCASNLQSSAPLTARFSSSLVNAVLSGQDSYPLSLPPMPQVTILTNGLRKFVPWEEVYGPVRPIMMPIPPTLRQRVLASYSADTLEMTEPASAHSDPQPEDDSPGDLDPPATGFYRVVRNGLHLFGITNGTVLSGKVVLPVEIGFDDAIEFDGFFAMVGDTNQTVPANGLEFQEVTNSLPEFVLWDTRQVTNGAYQVFLGAQWGETEIHESSPVTVIVSNTIWFPDSWNVAGYYINVEAQSIHANGTYQVDIYDDTGFQILQASGTNDSEGFITYGGFRGFVVENFDQNGEIYPSVSYTVVVTTSSQGDSPSATATNMIWTEFKWPVQGAGWTKFAIGYQPIFGNPSLGGINAVALQAMIQGVYTSAQARPGFPEGQRVIRGSDQNPYELSSQFDFTQLLVPDIRDDLVRNLYYFGHGAAAHIGQKSVPRYLSIDDLNFVLRNNFKEPLAGTNAHPFRFVWLDGCYTAKGDLWKAFGIPKEQNVSTNRFLARGMRYRAFMGWTGGHLIRLGSFNTQHATFVGDFWDGWSGVNTNGQPRTLREAHTFGATQRGTASPWQDAVGHLRIYGSEGLRWQDTYP